MMNVWQELCELVYYIVMMNVEDALGWRKWSLIVLFESFNEGLIILLSVNAIEGVKA